MSQIEKQKDISPDSPAPTAESALSDIHAGTRGQSAHTLSGKGVGIDLDSPIGTDIMEITDPNSQEFEDAYRVLAEYFPAGEMVPKEGFQSLIGTPENIQPCRYHFIAARGPDGTIQGCASFFYLHDSNAGFIGYVRVRKNEGTQIIGNDLMRKIAQILARDAAECHKDKPTGCFGEVEQLRMDTEDARKRMLLWERKGARLLDAPFSYPPIAEGQPPLPMHLIYYPANSAAPIDFSKDQIKCVAGEIYRAIYQQGDSPHLQKVLDAIGALPNERIGALELPLRRKERGRTANKENK